MSIPALPTLRSSLPARTKGNPSVFAPSVTRWLAIVASMALVITFPAKSWGQPTGASSPPTTLPTPTTPTTPAATTVSPSSAPQAGILAVPMEAEPFKLDAVGLTLPIPKGARADVSEIGGVVTVQVSSADKLWVVNIQTPRATAEMLTVMRATDQLVEQFVKAAPIQSAVTGEVIGTEAVLIEPRRELKIAGSKEPGERFTFAIPRQNNPKERVVQGYSVFRPLPDQFVIFEVVAGEANWSAAKAAYEIMVAGAKFEDPSKLIEERAAAVGTGAAMLKQWTSADWIKAIHEDQRWYRLYEPAPSEAAAGNAGANTDNATEWGYRGVRYWRGTRDEVARPGINHDITPTNPEGTLCQIDSRIFIRRGATALGSTTGTSTLQIVDSRATYFIADDRKQELWSLVATMGAPVTINADSTNPAVGTPAPQAKTGGGSVQVFRETGARSGRTLTVSLSAPGEPASVIKPLIQGEGYLSQAWAQLLPRMMVRMGTGRQTSQEAGFYVYRTDSRTITLRRDTITPDPKGRGMFVVTTRTREDPKGQVSVLNAEGDLLRTELSDGRVWEPTTPMELFRLYKSKGLPTGGDAPPSPAPSTTAPSAPTTPKPTPEPAPKGRRLPGVER